MYARELKSPEADLLGPVRAHHRLDALQGDPQKDRERESARERKGDNIECVWERENESPEADLLLPVQAHHRLDALQGDRRIDREREGARRRNILQSV